MSFWKELKRRNVYKVGVAYAIVAWLLIQFAAIAFPHLGFPSWAVPFVIVILIIGFPLALLLAWAYEVTPEGIKRTKEVSLSESITHLTGKRLNYILAGLLVLAIAYFVYDKFYLDRRATVTEKVPTETEQAPAVVEVKEAPKTIAVLPFEDLSPESDQRYFVDGLSEELLNTLTKISDLLVTARTSSFAFKGTDKTVQDIAEVLGVANVLEGSVRKAGNALRITAQLIRASDGFHLWSESYDRELKDVSDILSIQEDIARAVGNELKLTLGVGKSFKQLGGTDNVEAYELYLAAKGKTWDSGLASFDKCLELLDVAISLDPAFALAWAQKASNHFMAAVFVPKARVSAELDAGLKAAQRAIQLEPDLPEAYVQLVSYYVMKGNWIEAGEIVQKTLELKAGISSGVDLIIAKFYNEVGFLEKNQAIYEELLSIDPLNKEIRADDLLVLAFCGYAHKAEEGYKLGRTLFEGEWDRGDAFINVIRLGYEGIISRDQMVYSSPIFDAVKEHLESPEDALSELRRIYNNEENLSQAYLSEISMLAAHFGDTEFALEAIRKGIRFNASGTFWVWAPVFHEVRQTPRFKEFVREIGLVDYWNQFGWPDICHKLDNGDFECD